jgi:lipopolysaccharide transport system ATP-binding protein
MVEIRAENLVIEFPIYGSHSRSLKNAALRAATGGVLATDSRDQVVVRAIDGVTFEWRAGDRVGLVGNNGSGKTTLLRAMAGAYEPVQGSLRVEGSVISMLSITLGMEGEATGIENVYMRGVLMGLSKSEIDALTEEVKEFSELGNYIYMPMRTYSTGMMMRLAFAISTSVKADIVLMDEWLSVGDAEFSQKAEARLLKLIENAKILVMATHNLGLVEAVCNRTMHLHQGKIVSHT